MLWPGCLSAHNPEHVYAFGMDRLLQGVGLLVQERTRANAVTEQARER